MTKLSEIKFPFHISDDSGYNGQSFEVIINKIGRGNYTYRQIILEHKMGGFKQSVTMSHGRIKGAAVLGFYNRSLNDKKAFSLEFKRHRIELTFNAREVEYTERELNIE